MKLLIYLAGPYTKPNHARNVTRAIEVADKLVEMGVVPYIPHLSHFWDMISPKPHTYEFWLDLDFSIILHCDAVFRMEGESHGADEEVKFARSKGLRVFYTLEELRRWRDEMVSLNLFDCGP